MVERIANIGSQSSPQHCHNGLMRLLEQCGINNLVTRVPGSPISHMMLPSTYIKLLHDLYPNQFRQRLGATQSLVARFWVGFFSRPQNQDIVKRHPMLKNKVPADLATTLPCCVHQDAGPFSKTKSCDNVSFSSLLGDGDEKVTKYLNFTYIAKSDSKTRPTPCPIAWGRFLEDWDDLGTGLIGDTPIAKDEDGTMWCFILLFLKGDEENACNEWGMPHYGSEEVCGMCMANRVTRPFTDLRRVAAWRPTEAMPHEVFMARLREPLHPLMASPYCHRWFVYPDLMHLLDCKGVLALVYGGLLYALVRDQRLGSNKGERLCSINAEREAWYRNNPGEHRLPKIIATNLVTAGWAELSGPAIKAANSRGARVFFKTLALRFFTTSSRYDVCIRTLFTSLCRIYDILYASPMFLSNADIDALREECVGFGESYQELRELSRVRAQMAFPVRPKVRRMQHLPRMAEIINPTFVQCYAEESLVGTTTKVWKKSVAGRYQRGVQNVVLVKRLTALLLRVEVGA